MENGEKGELSVIIISQYLGFKLVYLVIILTFTVDIAGHVHKVMPALRE